MNAIELIQHIVAATLMIAAILFMIIGTIGLIRLPDFYTRSHATSKVDTLGVMILLFAFAIYEGFNLTSAKLVLGMIFIAIANPVSNHILARAAFHLGVKPWSTKSSSNQKDELAN